MSHDTIAKAKVIRDRADDATKERLRRGATTINAAHKDLRRRETREEAAARATVPGELSGKYRVIYADPPWRYGKARYPGCGDAESHYSTMSVEEPRFAFWTFFASEQTLVEQRLHPVPYING